jgi:NAD(P)H-dependent FMN reductase
MKITLVLSTAREGNSSQKVFNYVNQKLTDLGHEVESVNVSDHLYSQTVVRDKANLDNENAQKIEKWASAVESADAVIFVTPEYNHSYPGELKILIDSLYDEYRDKVAGIIGVSMGTYGGARVVELLKLLLLTVNFTVCNKAVLVSNVGSQLDEQIINKQLDGVLSEIQEKIS